VSLSLWQLYELFEEVLEAQNSAYSYEEQAVDRLLVSEMAKSQKGKGGPTHVTTYACLLLASLRFVSLPVPSPPLAAEVSVNGGWPGPCRPSKEFSKEDLQAIVQDTRVDRTAIAKDTDGDPSSLNRMLEHKLYLLVRRPGKDGWQLPEVPLTASDGSLRGVGACPVRACVVVCLLVTKAVVLAQGGGACSGGPQGHPQGHQDVFLWP
jgi:hypothetical protein